jgi:flagellar motor protein MotB
VDVVGHTDDKPVSIIKGDIVTNNFILSSLRASSAIDFFMEKGFAKSNLRATGVADSSEGSKTLSLQISAR